MAAPRATAHDPGRADRAAAAAARLHDRADVGDGHRDRRGPLRVHAHLRRRAVGTRARRSTPRCWPPALRHRRPRRRSCSTIGVVPQRADGRHRHRDRAHPGRRAGRAPSYTVTGEDVSLLLDREESDAEYARPRRLAPGARDRWPRTRRRASSRWSIPPLDIDPPLPIERIPTQQDTDLRHLQTLAARHGYVCYVIPGPAPGTSTLLLGPAGARRACPSRRSRWTSARRPTSPAAAVPPGRARPRSRSRAGAGPAHRAARRRCVTVASLRPPLAALPLWAHHAGDVRTRAVPRERHQRRRRRSPGRRPRSTGACDAVVAEGELDGPRYGAVLRPRGPGRDARRRLVPRRALVRPPGRPRARAGLLRGRRSRWPATGYGSTIPVVPMRRRADVLRQVPRHGREQRRPDAAGPGPGRRCPRCSATAG